MGYGLKNVFISENRNWTKFWDRSNQNSKRIVGKMKTQRNWILWLKKKKTKLNRLTESHQTKLVIVQFF